MYYIIVNPASRSGKGAKIWAQLEPVLKEKEIAYKVFFSKEVGHVIKLIRDLSYSLFAKNPDQIINLIVLGGDGTMNEVLQGIVDFQRTRLGYIPSGSSNDLARDLQLGTDPAKVLDRILACQKPTPMDLGVLTYKGTPGGLLPCDGQGFTHRYFAVSCGIGFDAAVCEEALISKIKKALNKIGLGKLTYLAIALKQLLMSKKVSCTITLEDGTKIHLPKFFFIASMQHRYEGGGFMFCPDADYQDGVLDICAVGNVPKWKVLVALPSAFKGNHYRFKGVEHYRTSQIRIQTSAPTWVHTDGEVAAYTDSITVSCQQQKLQVLI